MTTISLPLMATDPVRLLGGRAVHSDQESPRSGFKFGSALYLWASYLISLSPYPPHLKNWDSNNSLKELLRRLNKFICMMCLVSSFLRRFLCLISKEILSTS